MSHEAHTFRRSSRILALAALLSVMAIIFLLDTATEYAVAAAMFYTAVILVAVRVLSARAVVVLGLVCIALTLISFHLTPDGSYRTGLINTGISILAIVITAYLGLKMVAAQAAAHEAQTRLLHIARATNLGDLGASIAHEVNQPLAAIVTSGNACQRWLAQTPPNLEKARQAIDRILADADRASAVIVRLRSLAKGEQPSKSRFDLNGAALEVVALSRGELDRQQIALNMNLAGSLPRVLADRVQIQQVIGNLLLNAMEAMVATSVPQRMLKVSSSARQPGVVELSVADAGIGLSPAIIERLFDAFWTTKEEGTGLGLTISRSIIEANDGCIWAEPNPAGGAIFRFSVPIAQDETAP